MSEYKFLYWDEQGKDDCSCNEWQQQIQHKELGSCCKHAQQQEEDEATARMMIIMRNGNEGLHYDDYQDYTDNE